jgi:hypothetical protein
VPDEDRSPCNAALINLMLVRVLPSIVFEVPARVCRCFPYVWVRSCVHRESPCPQDRPSVLSSALTSLHGTEPTVLIPFDEHVPDLSSRLQTFREPKHRFDYVCRRSQRVWRMVNMSIHRLSRLSWFSIRLVCFTVQEIEWEMRKIGLMLLIVIQRLIPPVPDP